MLIVNYSPTYVLRSKGFDVHTKEKTNGSVQEWISRQHSFDIWGNIDGTTAKPTLYKDWLINKWYKQMTPKRYLEFYGETTKETGIYIITIGWRKGGGHTTILQRFADGSIAYIELQLIEITKGVKRDVLEICNNGVTIINQRQRKRGIMRVDDKLLKRFCTDSATEKLMMYGQFLVSNRFKTSNASKPTTTFIFPFFKHTIGGKP